MYIRNTRPAYRKADAIKYKLYFASLVSPLFLPETRLSQLYGQFQLPRKVKLKQSYLQLSWFFYMKHVQSKGTKRIHLLILPSRRKLYTLTKAPMAHKTNSKEQFMFKFYFFRAYFEGDLVNTNPIHTINHALFVLLIYKNTFPVFDTNLLYTRRCSVQIPGYDSQFCNYSLFLTKNRLTVGAQK